LEGNVTFALLVHALVARVRIALVASAVTAGYGRRVAGRAFVIHRIHFLADATGRLPPVPKFARMWKPFMAAVLLALTLTACQENKPPTPLITGGGNVRVLSVRFVTTAEAAIGMSGGTITYALTRVELTNDNNQAIFPNPQRFYLLDSQARHIAAVDTGSSVFIGVSNDVSILRPGEKREFTVGFRADASANGTVLYDYT
jgi:hypothetical protein